MVVAQVQPWLTEVTVAQAQLKLSEQNWLANLQSSPKVNNTRLITLGNLPALSQDGILKFAIPGVTGAFAAEAVQVEQKAYNDYLWTGKIAGHGHMMIMSDSSGAAGFIQLNDRFLKIATIRKNLYVLIEENLDTGEEEHCDDMEAPANSPLLVPCPTDNDCPAVITVLLLITPEAVAEAQEQTNLSVNWPWLYFALGAQTVNAAFLNSDVANKQIRSVIIPYNFEFTTNNDIREDHDTLRNNPVVAALRGQHKADIILLMANSRYGNAAGYANVGPGFNFAFGIVETAPMWGPRWTFAHELAHIFGAQHNTTTNGGPGGGTNDDPGCVHGFRFFDADQEDRRTIMARLFDDEGLQRILHYSNPAVPFNGAPSGDAADANVAATIRQNGCAVAAHFDTQELAAFIDGPAAACNETPEEFCADVLAAETGLPGQPPYTFAWHWNTTGLFTVFDPNGGTADGGTFLSSDPCITIGNLACGAYWLQLTVVSSDNMIVRVKRRIKTKFCDDCLERGAAQPDISANEMTKLVPNPASDAIQLIFQRKQAGPEQIAVFSSAGVKVWETTAQLPAGESIQPIAIGHLPSGAYQAHIQHSFGLEVLPFLIIR